MTMTLCWHVIVNRNSFLLVFLAVDAANERLGRDIDKA